MPMLLYIHQLFDAEQCQGYIHTLRWKDHIPPDLVVDSRGSAVRGSLALDFPCTSSAWSRNLPENNVSNINGLKIYH